MDSPNTLDSYLVTPLVTSPANIQEHSNSLKRKRYSWKHVDSAVPNNVYLEKKVEYPSVQKTIPLIDVLDLNIAMNARSPSPRCKLLDEDLYSPTTKRRLRTSSKSKEATQKEHDCIPDEHYVQTLFSMSQLDDELERRTLTYTSWNQSMDAKDKRGWHPKTFEFADASPQHITEIKGIDRVYYETEYRTEWCQCNATFVPCFLFARKFSRSAAMRILNDGLVGPFDAGSLFFPDS